jgi:Sulfotransferase domain
MIIISSSLPKSGSTLVYNYQQDMVKLANRKSGQLQLQNYSFHGFIGVFNIKIIATLLYLNFRFGDLVVKTHSQPTFLLKFLIFWGLAKATFCYRDPRDIILSAIDHGDRTRKGLDSTGAYQEFYNVKDSIPVVKSWIKIWYGWLQVKKVFFIQYERLIEDRLTQLIELTAYLDFEIDKETLNLLYEKHEKLKNQAWNFNKGTIQRYKTEMSVEEVELCHETLHKELLDLNYEL